jgi:cysteine desulfurase/selenocysteine lyase
VHTFSLRTPFSFDGVRVVAVTAASNVTGEAPDVAAVVAAAKRVGALVVVDAAQYTAHARLPEDGWGADVIVTSGHKMYGPVAVGAWFFAPSCPLRPSVVGGGAAEQEGWEVGTWSAADAQLLAGAWEFCAVPRDDVAWRAVAEVERVLGERVVRARGARVAPMVSYVPHGHVHDVAAALGERGVAVRAGQLCAPQALHTYGVGEAGVVRLSFGAMTTADDIDRLTSLL